MNLQSFKTEFQTYTWFQKTFFLLIIVGLLFYGALHLGWVKLPAARARDCSQLPKSENAQVINMENNRFEPKELTVNVCDTLLFLNLETEPHWPAVGPHPVHTAYPGFDAAKALGKFDYFTFQVTRPGTYSFHDHLHEDMIGKIIIKDIEIK